MSLGNLIFNFSVPIKSLIRRIEKNNKKIVNKKYSLVFNETCIKEQLLPNYTDIRTHDPAAREESITVRYRFQLIERQIKIARHELVQLELENTENFLRLTEYIPSPQLHLQITDELRRLQDTYDNSVKLRTLRKLNRLYRGDISLPHSTDGYINLSSHTLSKDQKELLNLGLNCHVISKFSKTKKQIELELLYDSLLKLKNDGKININPDLKDLLRAEASKQRGSSNSKILTPALRQAAKQLRDNDQIVIRKADKSNIFVILDKTEYNSKINEIVSDESKFRRLGRDPTEQIQRRANKLINTANSLVGSRKFTPIVGSYSPGYLYGNIKNHKENNPLRPIISQVTTPIYRTAQELDALIKPYIPKKFSLKSRGDFLEILRGRRPSGLLASLDVTNLFTNVPTEETLEIIANHVYSNESLPAPSIPKKVLLDLLRICTSESPFRTPDNKIYHQINGVAMGSPLGPTLAEFYMCELENRVLSDSSIRPELYCRYVDDIFVVVRDEDHMTELRVALELNSVLTFTCEFGLNQSLPFLDILVQAEDTMFVTKVYRKPTDVGRVLNEASECPQRYKTSTVRALIHRAFKTCTSASDLRTELLTCKQILVNNGFANKTIDNEISNYRARQNQTDNEQKSNESIITIYYQNQMTEGHKTDERVLKSIVLNNIRSTTTADRIKLLIYYKNMKIRNLIMKNNPCKKSGPLQETNVVYKYTCPREGCRLLQNVNYIGLTSTTLSRRLTCHLQTGGPKNHMRETHNETLTRATLETHTRIVMRCPDATRLAIAEALIIKQESPAINLQTTGFVRTLKLFS
jgi:uncharacterized protein (DUF1778 family)